MKKIIIFGAGKFGKYALDEYGTENVAFFVDNNPQKVGSFLEGIQIINMEELKKIFDDNYEIVIAIKLGDSVARQLEEAGITDFKFYIKDDDAYYPTSELVVNLYETQSDFLDYSKEHVRILIKAIDEKVKQLQQEDNPIFKSIEIETINRCNGGCSFCPVNAKSDPRDFKLMSEELFYKIIGELEKIEYQGKIALFSNNEPFLDERIIDFQKYAREHLPKARFHLFTNGTLLTLDKFIEIIPYLDELIIDNYNQQLELTPQSKKIVEYCEEHKELKRKVTVVLRKIDEKLSTRGGDAPNARQVSYPNAKCILPFQQMIVRPDGKVSLCCNDPLGKNTLADLTQETILEAWNNPRFQMVRKCLGKGRKNWKHCEHCDAFQGGNAEREI